MPVLKPPRKAALAAIIAVSVLTSCGTSPSQEGPKEDLTTPNWPERMDNFRFRWTSEPGIDLTTGESVPLRAYLESWLAISYTNNQKSGYPGYDRATPAYVEPWTPEWLALPQANRMTHAFLGGPEQDQQQMYGHEDLHVLQIDPIPNGFRSFVCDATFSAYRKMPDNESFIPLKAELSSTAQKADNANMDVWRIEFSTEGPTTARAPKSPTQPQRGPLPAPTGDVFGPWFVTGFQSVKSWVDSDHRDLAPDSQEIKTLESEARGVEESMRQRCLDRYPASAAQRLRSASTALRSPPPVEPAEPGWPE